MNSLPRVRPGLLRHPLEQQLLVYDTGSERVHLLDSTSGALFDLLTDDRWTLESIIPALAERTGLSPKREVLDLALEELRSAGLLDETRESIAPLPDLNRREALRSLALTGAAAALLPAITTLTASRAYAQGSAVGVGQGCNGNTDCLSGHCCDFICRPRACINDVCSDDTDCFSGNCCGGHCTATPCTTQPCGACSNSDTCAPPNTCISGTDGTRCSGGLNPTQTLPGGSGSFAQNCNANASARQNAANQHCCDGGPATLGACTGGNSGSQNYSCPA